MYELLKKLMEISKELNTPVYLVGGYVRDGLLKRPNDDVDFLVQGDPKVLARAFADQLGGSYILLDDTFQTIVRVVYKTYKNYYTFDFTGITEANLKENLCKRDFSINSLAISLDDYLVSCLFSPNYVISSSPLGMEDLSNGLIRANGTEVFKADPLRMLRAYRFAAAYGFIISEETLDMIKESCSLISNVSSERIRDEFFKLLKSSQSSKYIREMWEIGLLEIIFPEITLLNNTEQNGYHSLNVWEHCLQALVEFEKNSWRELVSNRLDKTVGSTETGELEDKDIKGYLTTEITKGRTKKQLLKFALLFHDIGKPATQGLKDNGRITFYGHDEEGSKLIKKICNRLSLSNHEKSFVAHLVLNHMRPLLLFNVSKRTDTATRKFFHKVQPEVLGIILHAFADKSASTGPLQDQEKFMAFKNMLSKIIQLYRIEPLYKHYQPILTGRELIDRFNLSPGPFIGRVLKALEKEYLETGIMTKEEAVEFCSKYIKRSN